MRASLLMAALVVLLHCLAACDAGLLRLRGSGNQEGDVDNGKGGGSGEREGEEGTTNLRPHLPQPQPPSQQQDHATTSFASSDTAKKKKAKQKAASKTKYRLPGQQTRREKWCDVHEQEVCGQGLGHLLCEYNDEKQVYATRCVRQPKTSLHLQLHPRNYCGACRRCFQDTDELRQAVAEYMVNNTEHTPVARNYGWPINKWCVSDVTDFSFIFAHQRKFREYLGDWDVSNAVNMSGMFLSAFAFNQDISRWNTGRVKDMSSMFDCAYEFNQPLADWDTQSVTTMSRMFRVAKSFDQNLNGWNTSRVKDMSSMFYRGHSFQQSVAWDVSAVTDMSYLFAYTRRFNHSSVVGWNVSKVQSMRGIFQNTGAFDQDVSSWDVSNVRDLSFSFHRALSFQEDNDKQRAIVTKWDLSNVLDKQNMFAFAQGALNATTVSQAEGVMLSHPSYDGSRMAQGMNLEEDNNAASSSRAGNTQRASI